MTTPSYPLRAYIGGAAAGTLSAALSSSVTSGTFSSSTSLASWTSVIPAIPLSGSTYLVIAIDYGTATEEKILCTWNTGSSNTLNIVARGYDGTVSQTHNLGALFIPVFSATEAAEANAAVQAILPLIENTGTSTTPGSVNIDIAGAQGGSTVPAAIDHTHEITSLQLQAFLTGSSVSGSATVGQVLTANGSGGASWANASTSSVSAANVTYTITTQSSSFSATNAAAIYLLNSALTVTLPSTGFTAGQQMTFVRNTSGACNFTSSTTLISTGATSSAPVLRAQNSVATAIYLGSGVGWLVTGDIS